MAKVIESDECNKCHQSMKANRLALDNSIDKIDVLLIRKRPTRIGYFSIREKMSVVIRVYPAMVFVGLMAYFASFISVTAVGVALIISLLIVIPLIFRGQLGQLNLKKDFLEISKDFLAYENLKVPRHLFKFIEFNGGSSLAHFEDPKASVQFGFSDPQFNFSIAFDSADKARKLHRILLDFYGSTLT